LKLRGKGEKTWRRSRSSWSRSRADGQGAQRARQGTSRPSSGVGAARRCRWRVPGPAAGVRPAEAVEGEDRVRRLLEDAGEKKINVIKVSGGHLLRLRGQGPGRGRAHQGQKAVSKQEAADIKKEVRGSRRQGPGRLTSANRESESTHARRSLCHVRARGQLRAERGVGSGERRFGGTCPSRRLCRRPR